MIRMSETFPLRIPLKQQAVIIGITVFVHTPTCVQLGSHWSVSTFCRGVLIGNFYENLVGMRDFGIYYLHCTTFHLIRKALQLAYNLLAGSNGIKFEDFLPFVQQIRPNLCKKTRCTCITIMLLRNIILLLCSQVRDHVHIQGVAQRSSYCQSAPSYQKG